MTNSRRILTEKFNEARGATIGLAIGNAALLICVGIGVTQGSVLTGRIFYCLASIVSILLINMFYDWKTQSINLMIFVAMIAIPVAEFLHLGFATSGYEVREDLSLGVLMEFIIVLTPYLYNGLRLLLSILLLGVIRRRALLK